MSILTKPISFRRSPKADSVEPTSDSLPPSADEVAKLVASGPGGALPRRGHSGRVAATGSEESGAGPSSIKRRGQRPSRRTSGNTDESRAGETRGSGPAPVPTASAFPAVASGVIGLEPRVDLLPTEVREARQSRALIRRLALGVIFAVIVAILATGGATADALSGRLALADTNAQTGSILAQQQRFSAVRKMQSQMALIQQAQKVGGSSEIDWAQYLQSVQNALPANVTITGLTIGSASPLTPFAQSAAPMATSRVATVTFTATSPSVPTVSQWVASLNEVPGAIDTVPQSVAMEGTGSDQSSYLVMITMDLNKQAFDNRFETATTKGK